ncbi:hypothetical protein [Nostoc sp. JL33]|nr:hypothetical protein [Nostoc sp. JL33]
MKNKNYLPKAIIHPPTKFLEEIYQTTQTTMTYWLFQGTPTITAS